MGQFKKQLDKTSTSKVGLLQGAGVVLYVLLFATTMAQLQHLPDPTPALAITLFLLMFITSALICGSLVLGYPLILAFRGKIRRAVAIVGWSAVTIVIAVILTLLALLAVS